MRERLLLLAGFLLLGAWHWGRLEQPAVPLATLALLGALAAAPAIVAALPGRRIGATVATLVGSVVVAVGAVAGAWPWERHHPFFVRRAWNLVDAGVHDWFSTRTPFDGSRFHAVDVDVRLAFYAIALGLGFLVLGGGRRMRPLLAIALAFVLVALPSTVLDLDRPMLRAGLFLALSLALLYASGEGAQRPAARLQGVALALLVCVAAVVIGQAPGVTKAAYLDWQRWNPLEHSDKSVSVNYVWNQDYGPLHWPKKRTTVFKVASPRPFYWRAAVLTQFVDDHWQANTQVEQYESGSSVDVPDSLLPKRARGTLKPRDQVDVRFHILALADEHLLSAGQPRLYQVPDGVRPTLNTDTTVSLDRDVSRDATYGVRSYVADPSPKALAKAGSHFPTEVTDGIQVNGQLMPAWGTDQSRALPPLGPDYMAASDLTWRASKADEARSEYAAVVALEGYFRGKPFVYDQTPTYHGTPLVDFMTRSHHGYCQSFSAAMALVLRLHGIPARVAVGFTEGTQTAAGEWTVTDHDAHSWVEVFFPGWGWLPFDPTPTRFLPERFSTAAQTFRQSDASAMLSILPSGAAATKNGSLANAATQQGNCRPGQTDCRRGPGLQVFKGRNTTAGKGGKGGPGATDSGRGGHLLVYLFWVLVAVAGLVVTLKVVAVRWRYLRRDPRSHAEAAYRELLTFVADQGVSVSASTTVEELAVKVRDTFGVDMRGFAAQATVARYAPPAQAARAARALGPELRGVKRQIRGELSRWDRLTGLFRLRAALSQSPATA